DFDYCPSAAPARMLRRSRPAPALPLPQSFCRVSYSPPDSCLFLLTRLDEGLARGHVTIGKASVKCCKGKYPGEQRPWLTADVHCLPQVKTWRFLMPSS